ncbi:MAG: type I 3-dehydroquinate dehydratase [Bacteroidales bacterium]|nr:type I 3-dehydroquinate dehydratase [Bacteroidales bacterium]
MKRRHFIKSSAGAGITGATVINGLFMNRFFSNPAPAMPDPDIPGRSDMIPMDEVKSSLVKLCEDSVRDNTARLSFLNKTYPVITALLANETPQELITAAKNSESDGAEGIAISLANLKPEFRNSGSLKSIMHSVNLPFMFYYYRADKWGKSGDDERQKLLLTAADMGASMIDVMGDLYDPSPMEITYDQSAIDKQKQLIDEIHGRGADVVMSSHLTCSLTTEQVVEHLRAFEDRGPDVVKIVTMLNTEEELAEAFSTTMTLKRELKKPYIHLCNGKFSRPHRFICPTLGLSILFAVPHDPERKGMNIPTIKEIKVVLDNIQWNINEVI